MSDDDPIPGHCRPTGAGLLLVLAVVATMAIIGAAFCREARADALPDVGVKAVAGVAHDVASGWKKPVLSAVETVVGPIHWGPVYLLGAGTSQSIGTPSPVVSTVEPLATYVAQGYIRGWFKGVALQVGLRQAKALSGPPGYYFLLGVSR